jgi:hypothetical protein
MNMPRCGRERGCALQKASFIARVRNQDALDDWGAGGQRAGLVEADVLDDRQPFEHIAAVKQDALLRRPAQR